MTGKCEVITDAGFTLVELLVAVVVSALVMTSALALATPDVTMARSVGEGMDVTQRARVARDAMSRDLIAAGAGLDVGVAAGPLVDYLPPVLPRRLGLRDADGYQVARADVVTLLSATAGAVQATLAASVTSHPSAMTIGPASNCSALVAACGFARGMAALMFDREGHFDLFTVTGAAGSTASIERRGQASSYPYAPGAFVAQVNTDTYYFDASSRQLRHYDTEDTDVPVIDDVVALEFEYFGDPSPPDRPRPPLGVENCLYDAAGMRKPGLDVLPSQGASLAALPLSVFTDGPWCGDGEHRFDADLLRVRQVRVHLRVQASPRSVRGAGADFAQTGSATSAFALVPDYSVRFDIAPRNMNRDR